MTTAKPFSLIALSLLALSTFAAPPQTDPAKLAAIPDKLKPFIEKGEISGAVTLLVTKDGVIHQAAVGESDIAARTPMKVDDVFWIASMTKPMTGVAILMLQDEGKLNVDDLVSKYLPEFEGVKTPSGKAANLTLKHLMTHTSGLAEASGEQQRAAKQLSDLIPHFVAKPTSIEPGTQWRYSQSGINTLGRIVEIVGGQPFAEFFEKRITGPLGMTDTTFYPSKEQQARLAKTYERDKDSGKLKASEISLFAGQKLEATDRTPLPNGGLFSTAADYGRFCRMLLSEGSLDGKAYLKPETVKLMRTVFTEQVTGKVGFVPGSGWGLTAIVVKEPGEVTAALSAGTFGHGGAYGTQAWIDPVKGVAYVLMVQRKGFPNADASEVRRTFQAAAGEAMR